MTVQKQMSTNLQPELLSLPARYYIDPANHQSELERFFLGMWFHAGRADEIPATGNFVLRDIAGESLIVTRADDGAIHAFYNVCRHRGTRLCEAARGTFDGMIRCPYHAWAYDLSGQLVAAPRCRMCPAFASKTTRSRPSPSGCGTAIFS